MTGIQVRQSKTSILFIIRIRKAVIPKMLIALAILGVGGLYLWHLPLTEAALARMETQKPLAVWIRKAIELKLDYDQVKRNPDHAIGKPILWYIFKTGEGEANYEGDPSFPLRLRGTFDVPRSSRGRGSHVVGVISAVQGGEVEIIVLGLDEPVFRFSGDSP